MINRWLYTPHVARWYGDSGTFEYFKSAQTSEDPVYLMKLSRQEFSG